MHKWLILLSVLSVAANAVPAYRWVDENGQVHYSDRPMPGATLVDLASAQTIAAPRPAAPSPESSGPTAQDAAQPYSTFNVVSPAHQETLWNIGGTLNVELALAPGLRPGHRLDVYLDGERLNLGTTATQFTVPEVFRGVHTLQAVVLGASGEEVLRSASVTFMVQQTSILNPNNPTPPAQRPRPAPNSG